MSLILDGLQRRDAERRRQQLHGSLPETPDEIEEPRKKYEGIFGTERPQVKKPRYTGPSLPEVHDGFKSLLDGSKSFTSGILFTLQSIGLAILHLFQYLYRLTCQATCFMLRQALRLVQLFGQCLGQTGTFLHHASRTIGQRSIDLYVAVSECCKSLINKVLVAYLPSRWLPNATAVIFRGCAVALSCCLVLLCTRMSLWHVATPETLASHKTATPHRKLRHFFRDPLALQQTKIGNALLAMQVDAVQRDSEGDGKIIIEDKHYGIGAQLMEHPSLWLEKVGKNSLYFSDKFGQLYKRAIQDMME